MKKVGRLAVLLAAVIGLVPLAVVESPNIIFFLADATHTLADKENQKENSR